MTTGNTEGDDLSAFPHAQLWDIMRTARTVRRFRDDPVDDAVLARCLEAATWAPNGSNEQAWRFVVLRSPAVRAVLGPRTATGSRTSSAGTAWSVPRPTTTRVARA